HQIDSRSHAGRFSPLWIWPDSQDMGHPVYCTGLGARHKKFVCLDRFAVPPGSPVSPRTICVPLLPSDPGGVGSVLPHGTQQSTKRSKHTNYEIVPGGEGGI